MSLKLPTSFYQRDTIDVARELLGKKLVHVLPNGQRLSGLIVETEAYLGADDPACHSFGSRNTPRTSVLFGNGGFSYVYFIYGKHFCFNIVTRGPGQPEAVLVRAIDPIDGIDHMLRTKNKPVRKEHLANGPGKTCQVLAIRREHSNLDLQSDHLFIENMTTISDNNILQSARIGLGKVEDALYWPLRFYIADHPAISRGKVP